MPARAGLSIGEAAGFALLERDPAPGSIALLGCGASTDGYHMSAPDPRGAGAISAMRQALASAGLDPAAIDYVNMHGTGTRVNDSVEDLAIATVFGDAVPVQLDQGLVGPHARRLRHPRGRHRGALPARAD